MNQSLSLKQQGFSLLEVLITLLIVAIGLLGMAGLQNIGIRANHVAYLRTQANTLAVQMLDRIRNNPAGLQAGSYVLSFDGRDNSSLPSEPEADCAEADTSCNGVEMAAYDAHQWGQQVLTALPDGAAQIQCLDIDTSDDLACTAGSVVTVTVSWQDRRQRDADAGEDAAAGRLSLPLSAVL